jgi:hypothetical protein
LVLGANITVDCPIRHLPVEDQNVYLKFDSAKEMTMKGARILLAIAGALAIVVSLALLLATRGFFATNGITVDDQVALIGQAQGSILLGVGVINLLAWRTSDVAGLRAVMGGNIVMHLAGLGVNLRGITANLVTSQVWGDVATHVIFAVLFAVFYVRVGQTAK